MGYNLFMIREEYDIVIIGAGASGLMLAANLDLNGSRGVILEGSSRAGSKLLMSGAAQLKEGNTVSVRGFGRFVYREVTGNSKKGRLFITIERYV